MSTVSQVFDTESESVFEIGKDLRILQMLPQAEKLLRFFFADYSDSARLPLQLESWLKNETSSLSRSENQHSGYLTASFVRGSRKLIVIVFIHNRMEAMTVSLREDPIARYFYQQLIQHFTRRQREVFHYLADGIKDVHVIASALGLSHRTVEEHRRLIFQKMKECELPIILPL